MIQSIVAISSAVDEDDDDNGVAAALYIYLHRRPHRWWLAVYPRPGERVFVVDLSTLGSWAGLAEARRRSCLEQLLAIAADAADNDTQRRRRQQQQSSAGVAARDVPSLRGLLESPSVAKVLFDARGAAAGLWEGYGVAVRGVRDVQLMELAGRRVDAGGQGVMGKVGSRGGRARPRDLRTCLE